MVDLDFVPRFFQLGPLKIHSYGVIFAAAVLAGYLTLIRLAPKRGLDPKKVEDLFFLAMPVSILGARLYHVLDLWSYYQKHPAEILAVWRGGLGIYGGIIAGLIFGVVYSRLRRLALFSVLDVSAPALAIGQAIGRWGNFVNQEAFGPPTDLPWGVPIEPQYRPAVWKDQTRFHPFFLYESFLNLVNFLILVSLLKRVKKRGVVAGVYFVNYGLIRYFLEFLRWDTWTVAGTRLAHLISLALIALGLGLILNRRQQTGS